MDDFLETHFDTIWWLSIGWVVLGFTAMYLWYRWRGRYFADPPRGSALYLERFASGCSRKSLLTILGGAAGCLRIWVTPSHLLIRPLLPCLPLGPFYDLVHSIPLDRVERVQTRKGWLWRGFDVSFRAEDGEIRVVTLLPQRPEKFEEALRAAIVRKRGRDPGLRPV